MNNKISRKDLLFNKARELGIHIKHGLSSKDRLKEGVHLLNPTLDDLEDAIDECELTGSKLIFTYTKQTWENTRRNQLFNN